LSIEERIPEIDDENEEVPDMEEFDIQDNLVDIDPVSLDKNSNSNLIKTRTYDLSITYDKYYQTPRIWLFGYDENGHPLKPFQIFEDISQDHAKKTVTIESHPHLNISLASVHPCRHSNVMKKIIDHYIQDNRELRVDQYLILFLKFMSCVLPTIEYDHTMPVES
jgi:ubiquitin-like-conjugating enzyme ATG3